MESGGATNARMLVPLVVKGSNAIKQLDFARMAARQVGGDQSATRNAQMAAKTKLATKRTASARLDATVAPSAKGVTRLVQKELQTKGATRRQARRRSASLEVSHTWLLGTRSGLARVVQTIASTISATKTACVLKDAKRASMVATAA